MDEISSFINCVKLELRQLNIKKNIKVTFLKCIKLKKKFHYGNIASAVKAIKDFNMPLIYGFNY